MTENFKNVLNGIVDVHPGANRFGLPGKIAHMLDYPGSPIDIGDNIIGHGPHIVIFNFDPAVEHFQKKVGTNLDHVKRLVDFVRHTGGHNAQGGHFAGLDQLGFLFHNFGHVSAGGNNDVPGTIFGHTDIQIDKKGLTAFAVVPLFSE
jgi:hypothetical protein